MTGKELRFKLVLDADTKNYVQNTKQSGEVTKQVFDSIRAEADKLRQASAETSKQIGDIVPATTQQKVEQLVTELHAATMAIDSLGDDAITSADNLKQMGDYGQRALNDLQEELSKARLNLNLLSATKATPADIEQAQRQVKELELGVKQAKIAVDGFSASATKSAKDVDEVGNSSTETAIQVAKLDNALDKTNQELQQTDTVAQKASNEIAGLKTGFNAVTGALAALGIGATAQEIAQTADAWAGLNARIKIAVGEHGNAQQAMADVVEIAKETNSNLTATGDLYARLTKIGQEMAIPQDQVLSLTKTINQAIQVSGGSADSAQAAITQLQQALSSGVLRGDEFNSMMEQSPRLTQAMADGLGVTTGELRKMANEGKLTTDVVTKSLLSQSEAIQKEFSAFPLTIGSSIENLKTSWTVFIGEMDQANGISAKVAESIKWVAENLDTIVSTLKIAAQAFIAYKALNIANVFIDKAAGVRAASLAITQETASVVANTQAQLANATATRAAAAAKTGLATSSTASGRAVAASSATTVTSLGAIVGRLGALGVAVTAMGVLIPTVFQPLGTWIGEGIAKLQGYSDATEDAEFHNRMWAIETKVAADMQKEYAQAAAEATIKTYALSKDAQTLVEKFQQLTKDGKPTSEALKEVGESMKFNSLTGINDAVSALNMLERTGKITGQELRSTLKAALINEDLTVFQTNAKAAFAGTAQESNKMAQVVQVAMELALERTGISTEQLKGQFSKTFMSANNDIQVLIDNLGEYKAQGVDTGLALTASLGNAIDTAQSRQELDYAKAKLIELGDQGKISGEQVVYGLNLIEEKAKGLPAVLDPVAASFAALGIQTREQLQATADSSVRNFNVVSKSGQATAEGIKQAYTKMLEAAIATGDKAQIAAVQAKAASQGLRVEIDATGKASVKSMDELSNSVEKVGRTARGSAADGFRELGRVAKQEAEDVAETWDEALSRIDKERKAQSAQTAQNLGNALTANAEIAQDFYNQLIAGGMDASRAEALKEEAMVKMGNQLRDVLNGGTAQTRIDALTGRNSSRDWMDNILKGQKKPGSVSSPKKPSIQAPNVNTSAANVPSSSAKTVTYKIEFGGKSLELAGDPNQQNLMNDFLNELEQLNRAR